MRLFIVIVNAILYAYKPRTYKDIKLETIDDY